MIPTDHEGQPVVVVRDPEGVCEGLVLLPLPAFFVVSCFNGVNKIEDIQNEFQREFGASLRREDILALSEQLDKSHLLQSPRYHKRRHALEAEFSSLPARPAAHAGEAYPAEPEAFRAFVDAFFTLEGGAGAIRPDGDGVRRRLVGMVAPHIDPRCGGACASHALKALAEAQTPEVFVVFGTAHQPLPGLFSLSDKDFFTPLGRVNCDQDFIATLRQEHGADRLAGGELVHKTEHSIEFPVVFLHATLGDPPPFTIVPILCGSLQPWVESKRSPSMARELEQFVQALRKAIAASGKRVCLVAGADLAHRGRKFGDDFGLSDELIHETRQRDMEMLQHVEARDPEAFFHSLAADGDERNVCGLAPMYTMLRCMDAAEGELLKYDYNLESATDSMVSFCSMAFYE